MQAATILAWQPVEVLWSDPKVLAYLNGPAPAHANDESQPGVLKVLEATVKALDAFDDTQMRLWDPRTDQFSSSIAALVQSRAFLVLGRIAHWLQQGPQPGTLDAEDDFSGAYAWRMCTHLMWKLATALLGVRVVHCYPQACAQLLASGMCP